MTFRAGKDIKALTAEELSALFMHPVQRETFHQVAQLTSMLRSCETPEDYYEVQRHLFKAIYETEERRAQCSRVLKRFRAGKRPPPEIRPPLVGVADSVDAWQLESFVFERAARQLRTVGDGLAWRAFGYDRRKVLALSRNDSPGMMFDKEGLPYELGRVEDIWRDRKRFALLHDLTNCLRIADVSEFTGEGILLHEVKKSARIGKRQMGRIQAAIDALMLGGPLPGVETNSRLVELDEPYAADLRQLHDVLQLAKKHGYRGMRLAQGRALIATSPYDVAMKWGKNYTAGMDWMSGIKSRAIERAGIQNARHHISAVSADTASRSPVLAPWSIYSLSSEDCAALTCDHLIFETIVSVDSLAASLEGVGLEVEILLPDAHGNLVGDMNILRARWRDRAITLHPMGLNQLLYELIRPETWASGIKEALLGSHFSGEPVLVYADEAKHWVK